VILYLDSSAIVKQYIAESGSFETQRAVAESEMNGTTVVSRAEVTAALRKAVRVGAVLDKDARTAVRSFHHRSRGAGTSTLETHRLILRMIQRSGIDAYAEMCADPADPEVNFLGFRMTNWFGKISI